MWSGIWSVITTRISFNQKQLQSDLPDTMDWGRKWLDFNAGKTQQVSFDKSNNNGATNVKMYGSVLPEKSSFKILGLTFSSKLDWGSYIISIAKTTPKNIGALIRSMKFLSPEVTLYFYKSTIGPCMVWNTAVISGLVPLVATWKWWISYKNGYAGLLVLHLLPLLNLRLIVKI